MAHQYGRESLEHEVAELRDSQKQLLSALRLLFDLLEAYAPSWYTEEHHKKLWQLCDCSPESQAFPHSRRDVCALCRAPVLGITSRPTSCG